jgi:hypothetical protein
LKGELKMKFYKMFLSGVILLSAVFSIQCIRNGSKGKIVSSSCSPRIGVINGQPDAGINVEMSIKNEGKAGIIEIQATLNSSEGKFSRTQKLYFKENEVKDLKFLIHEITINADNLECWGDVSP